MALYIRRRRQRRPPQDREAKPIILSTQPAGQPKPRENATPVLAVSPVAENDDAA
jgi:hypothetical protein